MLAGASGLVGRAILQGLLADDSVAAVHTLGRRELPFQHAKLTQHRVDFKFLPALPGAGEAFVALGTTIKVAGSQEAFRAVDFDAVVAVAKAAKASGATRLGVVSAMGANARSKVFYNRVKGEMEEALSALGFETLVIARPSFLVG
ncbi:MAG TPA: NAD(P)H-binding protein, partial [Ramlibacter sp.]|nr:NAD(P)H-binding protein [Ramlibacter sp.]